MRFDLAFCRHFEYLMTISDFQQCICALSIKSCRLWLSIDLSNVEKSCEVFSIVKAIMDQPLKIA